MRKSLPLFLLALTIASGSITAVAQNDRFAYAITDISREGSGWNVLRKLDLQTGEYSQVLLNGTDGKAIVYDAASKKQLTQKADARYGTQLQAPFSTGVAAAAYDRRNNRLYYTPMFVDQLRYIDLKTMKVYYVTDQPFTKLGNMHNDEGKCITRMVITPEGDGYALSNDGNTFIHFTTGKKTRITQLGSLVDDPSNKAISVHNKCTSFGGDMISDDRGNLYVLSARNQVFVVNTETKMAKHLGGIEGLPNDFTVNGAVVNADGHLLVSSAVNNKAYYVLDPASWEASLYANDKGIFRSSDLANSNYLQTRKKGEVIETITAKGFPGSDLIQIFPNPVTDGNFNVQFNGVPAGDYVIEVTDVLGRSILQKRTLISGKGVAQVVELQSTNARGIYLVKVTSKSKKQVFEQKILIQ